MAQVPGISSRLVPVLSQMELTSSKYCNITGSLRTTRNSSTIELHLDILERMHYGKMNTGYYIRTSAADNWIYNKTFDFCTFLVRPNLDRLMNLVREELRRRGPMPTRCPIDKGLISFQNCSLSYIRIPAFLPQSKFGLVIQTFTGKQMEPVFRAVIQGRLKLIN
ncbi:uncharacterized protein LOC118506238 [Anopheles stephensi]|uniref:uncharacterized protein LOC118506238 n=1 Tax=Anopheles stephensi TaxID=30069 RepID=UPI0016587F19|nr:uncharacterized protein LOC118506238 [Anopheles stephensi]